MTSDSPLPAQLCRPHPSFQAGNHTLCLEGQGTNGGRKGLLTAAQKQTIPQAQWQDGPTPFPQPMDLPAPRPPPPSSSGWSRQQEAGLHQAEASPPPHPDHPQGCPPPQEAPSPLTRKQEWGQHCPWRVEVASDGGWGEWDRAQAQGHPTSTRGWGLDRGAPPGHLPPGSCCSACWSGESRCVPGTPASSPRRPLSCGDKEGGRGDRKT